MKDIIIRLLEWSSFSKPGILWIQWRFQKMDSSGTNSQEFNLRRFTSQLCGTVWIGRVLLLFTRESCTFWSTAAVTLAPLAGYLMIWWWDPAECRNTFHDTGWMMMFTASSRCKSHPSCWTPPWYPMVNGPKYVVLSMGGLNIFELSLSEALPHQLSHLRPWAVARLACRLRIQRGLPTKNANIMIWEYFSKNLACSQHICQHLPALHTQLEFLPYPCCALSHCVLLLGSRKKARPSSAPPPLGTLVEPSSCPPFGTKNSPGLTMVCRCL